MLEHKRIRKNYYKNSCAKRRVKIIRRFAFCLKMIAGITALSFISLCFIFGYDFFTQCDYFRAESLIVAGNNRLSEKQVIKQAQINKRVNVLSVNLSMTRKRLLRHPWIAEAEVARKLPNEIDIRIKEHKPLAILDVGRKFIINIHGEIFKEKSDSDPENLPIISGLEFSDLNIPGESYLSCPKARAGGHAHSTPFDAVMTVLQLGQEAESILPNRLIKRIRVDREMGLTIYMPDYEMPDYESGRVKAIKLGYNDYPNKYDGLKNVLFYLNKKSCFSDFDSIDLNNLNRIVVGVESHKGV